MFVPRAASLLCVLGLAYAQVSQQRADNLLRDLLILDSHIDTPGYIVDEGYQLGEEHRYYETDIPRLKRGKVGALFFGVYVQPQDFPPDRWLGRALEWVDAVHQEVRRNSKEMELAYTAADIERIRQSGKIAALLSLEGGHIIQDSLPVLRNFYRLGVRYMTLTHFRNNNWADSGTDKAIHNGLSPFGRDVVREMNRLGMMIDISHVSDKTFYDVLGTTKSPVIASHSSLRAVCDIPRNMNDDMLRALAKNGGVVFINFNVAYLDRAAFDVFDPLRSVRDAEIKAMMEKNRDNPERFEMKRAIQKKYRQKLPKVDINNLLRHVDHAAKVMGVDHVGMGSDFDGISGMVPEGMEDVSKYPDLVKGLMGLGYSDADIRKIMGGNMLRVMRANEAVSKETGLDAAAAMIETEVQRGNIGAAAILVAQRGTTLMHRGFGTAKPDSVFLLASITKPVTAAALMLLVERGKVSLDDPVSRHLPEFTGGERGKVRVRDLLSHTSGLPDMLPENTELRRANLPLSEFVKRTYTTPLLYSPGTGFRYQSMGTLLAGEIVERVSGMRLRDFEKKEIFDPLNMRNSALGMGRMQIADTIPAWTSPAADAKDTKLFGPNSRYWRDMGHPWGGMHSTTSDLGRLLQTFLDKGLHNGKQIFSAATVKAMTTDQNIDVQAPWGLGWALGRSKVWNFFGDGASPATFGHAGATGTVAWADPESGVICIILTDRLLDEGRLLQSISSAVAASVDR